MRVTTISTDGLGDRTYVIEADGVAVVIDPQRDVDRITDHLNAHGLRLGLVAETHIHNDYVSGGLALSRMTGADYAINAEDDVAFDRRGVHDGEVLTVGPLEIEVVATAGHTHTHLSYVISHGGDRAVFTGGSMLYGTVGRTDLLGTEHTETLSRAQHRSVRGLAERLAPETDVFPTHGFGSFCASAGGGDRSEGTIATEREENIACTVDDEDEFVTTLVEGFSAHPPYYAHMGLLNRAGPLLPDLSLPPVADPDDLSERVARGEWVIDLRDRTAFAAGHLAGSVNAPLEGAFVTYVGWAIPWGVPLTLVGDTSDQVAQAQRELVRIGLDRPQAMAVGGPEVFAKDQPVASYPTAGFDELSRRDEVTVVDVRRQDEREDGHLPGSIHVPLEDVAARAAALPDGVPLWVHCASGYRASIATSLIAAAGKSVVLVDDDWDDRNAGR